MNEIYFQDTAVSAFQPLIDLTHSPFATLSSFAPLHWLESSFDCNRWGAFMHFYGPTRRLLKIGGLDLEDECFLKIRSSNKKWNTLINNYLESNLDIKEQFDLIRMLLYLGFYKSAKELCEKIISKPIALEDEIWVKYLQQLGKSIDSPITWSPSEFIKEIESLTTKISSFHQFHIFLLCAKFYIRNTSDLKIAKKYLTNSSLLLQNSDLSTCCGANLARIRLDKYKADFHFKNNESHKAVSLLKDACDLAAESLLRLDEVSSYVYLYKETKRRLLDRLAIYYYSLGNEKEALIYAKKSIVLDPYCSYAFILGGRMAANINRDLSIHYFEKATEYGIIERPYAKQALAQLKGESSLITNDLKTEAFSGNIFLISKDKSNGHHNKFDLPIEIKSLEKVANGYTENKGWNHIKGTTSYQRFRPFWELQPSNTNSPIFSSAPLAALEVFNNKQEPWFDTLYLQRAMPMNFRKELFFASAPHVLFAIRHQSFAQKLEVLKKRSDSTEWLLANYSTINTFSKLEKIHFCRLLGSIGFYNEALNELPIPFKNSKWDFFDEYAFCTKLFFEHIYYSGTELFPYLDIEFAFNKLSLHPKSLRMKLLLTMLACVYFGRRNDVQSLKKWRENGFKMLVEFQNNDLFNEFEKQLLTSRFYRAVSFYPYLVKDETTLRNEAEMCESYARNLGPSTVKQELLYKENLFPMLESMARIYSHIGDTDRSSKLMEEIVERVDPYDAKAWIQVGEFREKNNDFDRALEAFQTAIDLGAPLGGISCFRAGRVSEKIGDLKSAKHYYIRSLKFCPNGLSPLKRLNEISKELGDFYLKKWSEANLNNLKEYCNN